MSSPPTSRASTKAALLHEHQSFSNCCSSSLGGFHFFSKRAETKLAEPVEPYEVAPGTGILSTDATAIVFGYLDREKQEKVEEGKRNKKAKRKYRPAKDKKPNKTSRSNEDRSRSPIKKAYDRYREVHADDGTDDFRNRTHRKHVEAEVEALQEKRDDSYRIWKASQARSKRGRMVSEEDKLQVRGANPRTGIVTPNIYTARNSSDSGYASDYLKAGPHHGPTCNQGSWQQKGNGWNLVDDQDLHYYQQTVSAKKRDNDNLLTTRADISAKPHVEKKIARKKVGSGVSHRSRSEETVIICGRVRASSVPPLPEYPKQRPRVRVLTPQHRSAGLPRGHTHLHTPSSSLGQPPGRTMNQYPLQSAVGVKGAHLFDQKVASKWSSYPIAEYSSHQGLRLKQYQDHAHPRGHLPVPTASHSHLPPTSVLEVNQHLPTVHIPHPSHFNHHSLAYVAPKMQPTDNMESVSTMDATDVPTTTTVITTTPPASLSPSHPTSRPKPYRLDGTISVPKLTQRNAGRSKFPSRSPAMNFRQTARATIDGAQTVEPEDGYVCRQKTVNFQRHIVEKQLETRILPPILAQGKPTALQPSQVPSSPALGTTTKIEQPRMTSNTYTGWVVANDVLTMPVPYPVTPEPRLESGRGGPRNAENDFTKRVVATRDKIEGLRFGHGNIAARDEQGRGRARTGDGRIPMYDGLDEGVKSMFEGMMPWIENEADEVKMQTRMKRPRTAGSSGKSRTADGIRTQEMASHSQTRDINRHDSLKRRILEVRSLCRGLDLHLRPSAVVQCGIRILVVMVHHVILTLSPSSKALLALRKEGTVADEYWGAVKDVLWAVGYLMLLVNLLLVLGRIVRMLRPFARALLGLARVLWLVMSWSLRG